MTRRANVVDGTSVDAGRRRLLNWFLGSSVGALLAAAIYPVLRFVSPPRVDRASTTEVDVGPLNDPRFVDNGYKIVQFGADPVIVIRVSETDFRAFSAVCTHLACIIGYRKTRQDIWCNCHNGQFDLTGQVVSGPPPRPLERFQVHLVPAAGAPARVIVSRS
jgi:cytochrome b6-f complex iron-sulfur subunit